MIKNFENLTLGVSQIYKSIQKIKKHRMNSLGLKGTHVMCIYYLSMYDEGLTASDLCHKCQEDKAGISRILSDLEGMGYITYESASGGKKYRTKAFLTGKGFETSKKVRQFILSATALGGDGITEEERSIFYRVLFTINDNLKSVCEKLENE